MLMTRQLVASETTMNKSLALANSWLFSNRLLINIKKSNFIIIDTRHNVANIDNITLRIDDQTAMFINYTARYSHRSKLNFPRSYALPNNQNIKQDYINSQIKTIFTSYST